MDRTLLCLIMAGIAAIAGCATPNDLRRSSPSGEFRSEKPAKRVAICIAEHWENSAYGKIVVSMRETEDGYTISDAGGLNTILLADISNESNGGSTTRYFSRGIGTGAWGKDVANCQ